MEFAIGELRYILQFSLSIRIQAAESWKRLTKKYFRILAIFLSPSLFEPYRVMVPFVEIVEVANRFRVRPMLPLLEQNLSFVLLAISENKVAFYAVDQHAIKPIKVAGLPANLTESLTEVRYIP